MNREQTAWALFDAHRSGAAPLSVKAGSFVGQIAVDPRQPLTDKQASWLGKLTERAGLPPLAIGGDA
jgi:hypothetical protein